MTKRILAIVLGATLVVLSLLFSMVETSQAVNARSLFNASISVIDPCNGQRVVASGTTTLAIRKTSSGPVVTEAFTGSEAGLTVNFSGAGRFGTWATGSSSYDIGIHGQWSSSGIVVFTSGAVDRIFADSTGHPTGDTIQALASSCR